jgi:hypothetical protein
MPAAHGLYEIRGLRRRSGRLPHFDDLLFLAGSMSRYPLEGYREKCTTKTRARHRGTPGSRSNSTSRSPSPA